MDLDELIRQGKVKRIFRAKRKLTLPNLVSHITQRAAGKDPLFIEDQDYLAMLANLKAIAQKRSLAKEDVIEHNNAVHNLQKALIRFFPTIFSGVENSKRISKYSGLNLLDEEQLDQKIMALKSGPARLPETRKARRFIIEQLMARGFKRDEIANRLGVSVKTIYNTLSYKA